MLIAKFPLLVEERKKVRRSSEASQDHKMETWPNFRVIAFDQSARLFIDIHFEKCILVM